MSKLILSFIALLTISLNVNAEFSSSEKSPPAVNNTNTLSMQPNMYVKEKSSYCNTWEAATCQVVYCNSGHKQMGIVENDRGTVIGNMQFMRQRVLCAR